MHTSARSDCLHCSRATSPTSRTAVYGPVRTVVWQGSAGDCRPYADQTPMATPILQDCWFTRFQLPCRHFRTDSARAYHPAMAESELALNSRFNGISFLFLPQ